MEKKIKLYNFEELENDVKEKLIKEQMENEYNFFCDFELEDVMKEETEHGLLPKYFKDFTFNRVFYDLSYSQGSGAMVEFEIYLETLNEKYKIFTEKEIEKIKNYGETLIKVKHSGNYYHIHSFEVDYSELECYNTYIDAHKNIQEKLDKLIELFKEDVVSLNGEIEKYGYSLLEDEEHFRENGILYLQDSDTLYFKNGDIFKEDYE